jgi:PAS domain S-box-containing protein
MTSSGPSWAVATADRDEAQYRSLLELAPDAFIACDPDAIITFWNRGAEATYGWSAHEATGRNVHDLLTPNRAEPGAGLPGLVETGAWQGVGRHRTKNGRSIAVEGRWKVVRDGQGAPVGLIGTNRDVTSRRAIEDELSRSNAELLQFAYVASHDLAEPLRTVASFIQLLAQRYVGRLDADADEFIGFTLDGVKQMQTLIQDLLSYSNVSHLDYNLATVDCAELIAEVCAALHAEDAITHSDLPCVMADASQLRRVFQNLIGNGLKFVPPDRDPAITVAAHRREGCWQFSVADNGIGIAKEYRDQIFKMFLRLHNQDEFPGSGMGLSICQRIVERHGGQLWIESVEHEGSTFHFTIPDAAP